MAVRPAIQLLSGASLGFLTEHKLADEQRSGDAEVCLRVKKRRGGVELAFVGIRVHLEKVESSPSRRGRADRSAKALVGVIVALAEGVGGGELRPRPDRDQGGGGSGVDRRRLGTHEAEHLLHRYGLGWLRPARASASEGGGVVARVRVGHVRSDGALRLVDDVPAPKGGLVAQRAHHRHEYGVDVAVQFRHVGEEVLHALVFENRAIPQHEENEDVELSRRAQVAAHVGDERSRRVSGDDHPVGIEHGRFVALHVKPDPHRVAACPRSVDEHVLEGAEVSVALTVAKVVAVPKPGQVYARQENRNPIPREGAVKNREPCRRRGGGRRRRRGGRRRRRRGRW
mmetsp:Transcript_40882/g.135434  ORF Transcript_40882/g.135434 Transcript_40882/m.135434 type:complete len:342 (+) Transcript_40882:502-1527(+)